MIGLMILAVVVVICFTVLGAYIIYYHSHAPYQIEVTTPTDTESLKRYDESLKRFLAAHWVDV